MQLKQMNSLIGHMEINISGSWMTFDEDVYLFSGGWIDQQINFSGWKMR